MKLTAFLHAISVTESLCSAVTHAKHIAATRAVKEHNVTLSVRNITGHIYDHFVNAFSNVPFISFRSSPQYK